MLDQVVSLTVEKAAAGGRMIAHVGGKVIFVEGGIPGERVVARVDRTGKDFSSATVVRVESPSDDRRPGFDDPRCGGCLYSHIAYPRQLEIKSQVIADAFARIGRIPLPSPVHLVPSPEHGYRMRARLHVRGGNAGFFREGTHDVCSARATLQLLPQTCEVIDHVTAGLRSLGIEAGELELTENTSASERVIHFQGRQYFDPRSLAALRNIDGVSGLTASWGAALVASAPPSTIHGRDSVSDVFEIDRTEVTLRRHVLSFFQGNRYLLRGLVAHVIHQVPPDGVVVDLYAGTGLFSVAVAIGRNCRVTAVEADRAAWRDLQINSRQADQQIEPVHKAVEAFAATARVAPDAVIVDPPRTGLSRDALEGVLRLRGRRIVYVSCDTATLARDSRRIVDAGYVLGSVEAFDLFPNTPHVETIVVFDRALSSQP